MDPCIKNHRKDDYKKYMRKGHLNFLFCTSKMASHIAVRVLAYCVEDPQFEIHFELRFGRLSHKWGSGGNTGEIKAVRKGGNKCHF